MSDNSPTGDRLVEWIQWLSGRPQGVKDAAAKCPPWKSYVPKGQAALYRERGETMHVASYDELTDDTVKIQVAVVKAGTITRYVFGYGVEDLEPLEE